MDKGPWHAGVKAVYSDDFLHDVRLDVTGDFPGKPSREDYCRWLAGQLNEITRLRAALEEARRTQVNCDTCVRTRGGVACGNCLLMQRLEPVVRWKMRRRGGEGGE